MYVRITRRCLAPVDGFSIVPLEVGRVYDLKAGVAAFLIARAHAEPYECTDDDRSFYTDRDIWDNNAPLYREEPLGPTGRTLKRFDQPE